jgi:hypothetical protein
VPDDEKVCFGRDLAEALARTELPKHEAKAWHRDLRHARETLKAPADKCDNPDAPMWLLGAKRAPPIFKSGVTSRPHSRSLLGMDGSVGGFCRHSCRAYNQDSLALSPGPRKVSPVISVDTRMLAAALQARGAFFTLFLIYSILCAVPLLLGAYLLIAPDHAGNFLNDSFAIFPSVEPEEIWKKWAYRALGAGFIWVSIYYAREIYLSILSL